MPKAYSYLRMSTEIQLKGDSLRRQLELSKNYAEKHGLSLESDHEYKDIGVSAFKGDNIATGALGRFRKAVEQGKIEKGSYLLVESLDRLSREDVLTALKLFVSIIDLGIVIVTLTDGTEYSKKLLSSPEGIGNLMYSLMVMSRAHDESLTKSKRIGAAWSAKRAKAGQLKLTAIAPSWLKLSPDRKSFEIIEGRAELVQKIFENCKNGVGVDALSRILNGTTKPWNGTKGWHKSFLYKVLTNRAVLGEYLPHKYTNGKGVPLEPITDYFPRIISDDLFYAAKLARESRKYRGGRKGERFPNLFSTLAKCGYCKRPIRMVDKGVGPKGGRYLRCEAAVRAHGCHASSWQYKHFETNFLSLVTEVDFSQIVSDESAKTALSDLIGKRTTIAAKVKENEQLQQRLLAALEDFASKSPAIVVARIRELESSVDAAKKEVALLDSTIQSMTTEISTSVDRYAQIKDLNSRLQASNVEDSYALRARLAQLIRGVVSIILLYSDGHVISKEKQAILVEGLQNAGIEQDRINNYFDDVQSKDQRSSAQKRAYFIWFRSGQYRFIQPHQTDPTKYSMMRDPTDGLIFPNQSGDEWKHEFLKSFTNS